MPKPNVTPITPVRFTPGDLAIIEAVRVARGLSTVAATLRTISVEEFKRLGLGLAPTPKKRKEHP